MQGPDEVFLHIPLDKIRITGMNPRRTFDEEALEDLKSSIREHGILEPLVVRPDGNGGYELVAGERRYRAARDLGLGYVPAVVRDLDDRSVREIMLIENLQREDLNPIEEASALKVLLEGGLTQEELARRIGKSQPWVANRLRLLDAPEELRRLVISRQITPKHVHLLLPFVEHREVYEVVMEDLRKDLEEGEKVTVKDLEKKIQYAIRGSDSILNLTDFPWEYWEYREHFDFTGCDRCRHSVKVLDDLFCLNRRCWKDRMNIAKQRYEKEKEEKEKEQKETPYFLGFNPDERWIRESCPGCRYLTVEKDDDGDEIWRCANPDCARQKEEEYQEWLKRYIRERRRVMDEAFNRYLEDFAGLTPEVLRIAVMSLSRASFDSALKKALKPWIENEDKKDLKWGWWTDIVPNIPDEDLPLALVRILYYDNMGRNRYEDPDRSAKELMIEIFPPAARYLEEVE